MSQEALDRYAAYFATVSPASLDRLSDVFTDDVEFRDPFNHTRGLGAVRRVFERMYESIEGPRFDVLHTVADGRIGYLKWRFSGRLRGRPFSFVGMSEIVFRDGKAAVHVDYWDAASEVYEKVPLLGRVLRVLRRRIAIEPAFSA